MTKAKMDQKSKERMWDLWRLETFRRHSGKLAPSEKREFDRLKKQYNAERDGSRDDVGKVRI